MGQSEHLEQLIAGRRAADAAARVLLLLALASACVAYYPALDNGFISDDYVMLERVSSWIRDFRSFAVPPEGLRLTVYACYALLERVVGYQATWFYAFAIALHLLNIFLVYRLLRAIVPTPYVAATAALLFAVFAAPQEAVMWLPRMNDSLVATFTLATLLAWVRGRFGAALLTCALALLSKESAVVIFALVPVVDAVRRGRVTLRREYLLLLIPAVAYAGMQTVFLPSHALLNSGQWRLRPGGAGILMHSVHRMAFPWIYIAGLCTVRRRGDWTLPEGMAAPALWFVLAMLPYSFLTYQNHIPSGNLYPAAIGFCWLLATVVGKIPGRPLRAAFLAVFVAFNIGYLWIVKDVQFRERAAPTEQLLQYLAAHKPGCLSVDEFPLNPWIAKDVTLRVPGWEPWMIHVNEPAAPGCPELRWNAKLMRYE